MTVRLQPASNWRQQARNYKNAEVFQSAAKLWVEGVPWDTALNLSQQALNKASLTSQGRKGKGKGRGKAKPAAKAKART